MGDTPLHLCCMKRKIAGYDLGELLSPIPFATDSQALLEVAHNVTPDFLAAASASELTAAANGHTASTPGAQAYAAACEARKQSITEGCNVAAMLTALQESSVRPEAEQNLAKAVIDTAGTNKAMLIWQEAAQSTRLQSVHSAGRSVAIAYPAVTVQAQLPQAAEECTGFPDKTSHSVNKTVADTAGAGSCCKLTPQLEPALASGPEVKTEVRPAGSGTGKKVSSQRLHCSAGYLQRGLSVTGKAFWVPQTACSPCLSRLHRPQTALKKSPSPATRQSPSCRQAFRSTEDDAPIKHQDLRESVA